MNNEKKKKNKLRKQCLIIATSKYLRNYFIKYII